MAVKKSPAKPAERLFLLDGMALAYRAYFSFISRPLINSRGENTSAIFGFVNTLMKILNVDRPEHIAVVFDTKEPTFRHKMFGPYKATREKMPEDMAGQLDKLKEVVRAFNVPGLELPGFEADDVMGTLARMAERSGIETYLVTGDKDFMQLISPLIRMYKPGKQGDDWEILDERAVTAKFGVRPALVTEVLAIIGDKSDNVPGVRGIGDKTAIPLVQEFETLENLYRNLDRIPQKGVRQKLADGEATAYLSRKLVTIDTSAPVNVAIDDLVARPPDVPKLLQLFAELEFRALQKKFAQPGAGERGPPPASPGSSPPTASGAPATPGASPAEPRITLADVGTFPHKYVTLTSAKDVRDVAAQTPEGETLRRRHRDDLHRRAAGRARGDFTLDRPRTRLVHPGPGRPPARRPGGGRAGRTRHPGLPPRPSLEPRFGDPRPRPGGPGAEKGRPEHQVRHAGLRRPRRRAGRRPLRYDGRQLHSPAGRRPQHGRPRGRAPAVPDHHLRRPHREPAGTGRTSATSSRRRSPSTPPRTPTSRSGSTAPSGRSSTRT